MKGDKLIFHIDEREWEEKIYYLVYQEFIGSAYRLVCDDGTVINQPKDRILSLPCRYKTINGARRSVKKVIDYHKEIGFVINTEVKETER